MRKAADDHAPWFGVMEVVRGLGDAVSTPRGTAPDRTAASVGRRVKRG
jgi:hypothetical protein